MPKEILIGIDLGTTVLKVCAIDGRKGNLLVHDAYRIPARSLPHGGREQKLSDIGHSFRKAIQTLKAHLGSDWRNVKGIGLAAQGGSTIIADRQSGKALTPMILWDDGRTGAYTEELTKKLTPGYWHKYLLCGYPPAGLGRLMWLKEKKPQLFNDKNIHIGAGEYLFHRLTGVWRQDAGNAIQIGSYDAAKKKLIPTLLKLVGIPLFFVAPLRQGHEITPLSAKGAKILDLPENVPVAGPYIDQETGYLSACGTSDRPLQCSLGTAWVGNFVLPDGYTGHSPTQLVIPSPLCEGGLVIQPLLTGNMTWEWGLRQFIGDNELLPLKEADRIFKSSLLPENNLVFLPWLDRRNPLDPASIGAGIFHGLSPQTGCHDILRALAASLCFEFTRMFEEIKQKQLFDRIVLGGGASKGRQFQKLIAGLFDPIPVYTQMDIDFSTARGSVYAFDPRIARTKTKRIRLPNENTVSRIRDYYHHYLRVFNECYRSETIGQAFHVERKPS